MTIKLAPTTKEYKNVSINYVKRRNMEKYDNKNMKNYDPIKTSHT